MNWVRLVTTILMIIIGFILILVYPKDVSVIDKNITSELNFIYDNFNNEFKMYKKGVWNLESKSFDIINKEVLLEKFKIMEDINIDTKNIVIIIYRVLWWLIFIIIFMLAFTGAASIFK